CLRKRSWAEVTVRGAGSGKISINGRGLDYFAEIQSREQPATKARWRHGRSTRSNRLTLLRSRAFNSDDEEEKKSPGDRMQLGPSPPLDDDLAPLFESFEHAVPEELRRNGGRAGDASALHSAVQGERRGCAAPALLGQVRGRELGVAPAGCAPRHLARDLGKSDCLRLLAEWEGVDLNVQTTEKSATALHLAAENGLAECVALLLARGADANVRNYRGQVPLHLAARAQSVECVETLLRASSCDVNVTDDDLRTPLHAAVGKALQAYEVAETLISWRADVNACDCFGYTPLHVAALNELAQCVETLLYHGADVSARTHGGTTALSIIVRKTPASLNTLYAKFDAAISMHDPEVSHREVELKLDFRQLLQHSERGEIAYLKTFVDEGQKEVLKHPLCEAFLHLKWQKIRKFYVVKLIFCFLFVLSLTLYVMSALAHNCFNEHYYNSTNASSADSNRSDNSFGSNPVTEEPNKPENRSQLLCTNSTIGHFFRDHPSIIIVEWYILLLFTFCEIFRKIFGFSGFSTVKEYVSQVENLLEWFVVVSVFTISCVFTNRIYEWQNHIGAFAVLFGWWNLMHMLGQLPLLGSYVAMYTRVQREFLKLFAAYLCLLIGFTISFCVIFPAKAQFGNPFISFMKVLVMMTGELEFDSIFFDDNPTALPYSAHFIFIIFLLFATVVLMNLLVGIAVHDIQGLQKTAGLLKLEQQTRLISYSVEITRLLIERHADVNARDRYEYTPLHVAANNDLAASVRALLLAGADVTARTRGGATALAAIVRKMPCSLKALYQKMDNAIGLQDANTTVLDSATSAQDSYAGHEDVVVSLNFRPLIDATSPAEISYLKTFLDEGHKDVLKHPLCQAFLHYKWQKIMKFYLVKMAFYILLVMFLTIYVISSSTIHYHQRREQAKSENCTPEVSHLSLCKNSTAFAIFIVDHPSIKASSYWLLVVLALMEVLRKICGVGGYESLREYARHLDNVLEWVVALGVCVLLLAQECNRYEECFRDHLGAITLLLAFFMLTRMIGHLPQLESYVAMYMSVLRLFVKVLAAYLSLLLGFVFGLQKTADLVLLQQQTRLISQVERTLLSALVPPRARRAFYRWACVSPGRYRKTMVCSNVRNSIDGPMIES
ncbi:Transient receptor potential channel pyrexia, partial [Gryllus bimaculatus]